MPREKAWQSQGGGWWAGTVRSEWARSGPSAPARPSSPAHSCTGPALRGSTQQTPWPYAHAAPACPCGGVEVAAGAWGGPGGVAPLGRTAAWSTTCPAELAGDGQAGKVGCELTWPPQPCSEPRGPWPSPSLSVRNTNTLWPVMTWNLLSLLLRVISMAVRGITPLGKGSWRDRQPIGPWGQEPSHVRCPPGPAPTFNEIQHSFREQWGTAANRAPFDP